MPKKKLLITAGPTREMLDPVRFLSNLSTGEMGYTLARVAQKKGYDVTLISGPTFIQPPKDVRFVQIVTSKELKKACDEHFMRNDILIMSAAVCDFTPALSHKSKIKRLNTKELILKQTPDIVAGLARRKGKRKVIGFSLETDSWLESAEKKCKKKHLDGIVANYYVPGKHVPFGKGALNMALVSRDSSIEKLENVTKLQISRSILKWVEAMG